MAIPLDAVRIEVAYSGSVPNALNVWHGLTDAAHGLPTVANAQVLVDRLRDFYTGILDQIATGVTITVGSKVIAIGADPEQFVAVTPRVLAGTRAGEILPLQTCLTVKLRTPNATRRGRGRIFLNGFLEDQNSNGSPSSTLIADINANAPTLISSPPSTLPALAILSRVGSGTPAAPNPYLTGLSSAVAGSSWVVLRSRRK